MMSCTDKPITMNLYYTGENGNARRFVEEMESSGTADAIRAEEGNLRYDYFFFEGCPGNRAAKDSWFQHLTYHKDVQEGASNEWLEKVADNEYGKL